MIDFVGFFKRLFGRESDETKSGDFQKRIGNGYKKAEIEDENEDQGVEGFLNKRAKFIRVNVLKNRGNALEIIRLKARAKSIDKESEINQLVSGKKVLLDQLDYSRMNKDGSLTLIEKPDGQLTYAELSQDVVNSAGEGILRDAFIISNDWINDNFKKKEDAWARIGPVLMFGLTFLCVIGSLYLTYGYLKDAIATFTTIIEGIKESLLALTSSIDRITRTQSDTTDKLLQITENLRQIEVARNSVPTTTTTTTTTLFRGNITAI